MLRHSSDQPQDIVFEAEEDLFHNSPGRELLMLKGSVKVIPLTRNRMFQSYVNEFCGMVSAQSGTRGGVLASNTLRFSLSGERGGGSMANVNPCKIVSSACHVKVSHTHEFHNAHNNSLKPALRSIFEQGFCSDFKLSFEGKKVFNLHKSIMAVRSPKIARQISAMDPADPVLRLSHQGLYSVRVFEKFLIWLYSGELGPSSTLSRRDKGYIAIEEEEEKTGSQ